MSEEQGKGASFEARLRSARSRQGLDLSETGGAGGGAPAAGPGGGAKATGPSALGIGMRAGVEVVSALAVAVAIGWGLDRWLHTLPLFLIVFVLLGGAAGVMNVWRLVGPGAR